MKGDFHVRFCEKLEVKVLLLTRLRGRRLVTASYSIELLNMDEVTYVKTKLRQEQWEKLIADCQNRA